MNGGITTMLVALAVAAALAGGAVSAQRGVGPAPATPPAARDISGYWELSADSYNIPSANLAPGVTSAVLEAQARKDAHAIRWCNILGLQATMGSSRPIEIRHGRRMIVIANEINASPRYLYLDRTTHINRDDLDPTTTGDSIARWEGDTFVVDTVGFHPDRGITAIPGGGFRTADSHVVERYRLLNNGAILSVTFIWEDPKVFRTPHTYEFRYYRLGRTHEPRPALPCDPPIRPGARGLPDRPPGRLMSAGSAPATLRARSSRPPRSAARQPRALLQYVRISISHASNIRRKSAAPSPPAMIAVLQATAAAASSSIAAVGSGLRAAASADVADAAPYSAIHRIGSGSL